MEGEAPVERDIGRWMYRTGEYAPNKNEDLKNAEDRWFYTRSHHPQLPIMILGWCVPTSFCGNPSRTEKKGCQPIMILEGHRSLTNAPPACKPYRASCEAPISNRKTSSKRETSR